MISNKKKTFQTICEVCFILYICLKQFGNEVLKITLPFTKAFLSSAINGVVKEYANVNV